MKNLILSLLALCGLGLVVGCSCDERHTEESSSATMNSYDSKDMVTTHHHHYSDNQ